MSVVGSTKEMNNKTIRIRNAFKRGLMKVAMTASAWIVTHGINFGVSKLVSEAVIEEETIINNNLILIGICQWGKVALKNMLIVKKV